VKKVVLGLALVAILAVGAFAEHPDGWGIGTGFQFGNSWTKWSNPSYYSSLTGDNDLGLGLTLYLKAPRLPVYWGISLPVFNWKFDDPYTRVGFGITGDYYIFDQTIVPAVGFGWFLGVGGYLRYWHLSVDDWYGDWSVNLLDFGVRAPIGIYIQPLDFLDVFLDIAPSVGFYTWLGDTEGWDHKNGLGGGWQGDLGVRFWF